MRYANELAKILRFNTSFLLKFCNINNKVSVRPQKCEGGVRVDECPSRALSPLYIGVCGL